MWICFALTVLALNVTEAAPDVQEVILVDFSAEILPDFVRFNNTTPLEANEKGLAIRFERADWPNVFFQPPEGTWNWNAYAGVGIDIYNPSDIPVTVALRLDNAGADGMNNCNNLRSTVLPQQRIAFKMWFNRGANQFFWGMRGIPGNIKYGEGKPLDLEAVTAFQLFLPMPNQQHLLQLEKFYVFGEADAPVPQVPLPFVDTFGQYMHADWPGKLHAEDEFSTRRSAEEQAWKETPALPDRDRVGGWESGPRKKKTGWFRTEQINGKWWLITPEGSLFLSFGMDCVGTWERTFVEKREEWFAWLPPREDPLFGSLYSILEGAHSMAEPVDGKGMTFSFYGANLIRKYGDEWKKHWRDSVYPRLRHWGFNTIGNWSQEDVLENSNVPFVASASIQNVRRIESAQGYWSKMMDVYDPSFMENVEPSVDHVTKKYGNNPFCIGYFVDNELAWEGVVDGVLAANETQPAREALLQLLRMRYDTLEALNQAWETTFDAWESVRRPETMNAKSNSDLDDFLYFFAHRYFLTIRSALKKNAPNQLYLGCRFASAPEQVVRACADVADIVSFNLYYPVIPADNWAGAKALNKPILIGEFHFGALDRGMFHTGLVSTQNQEERAAHYYAYVKSVIEHPGFVGAHWFQYIDEPITGRWFDGENYNIGFLDVTDTPYPELVKAARDIHEKAYSLRYGDAPKD